jgi:hypothetical protein
MKNRYVVLDPPNLLYYTSSEMNELKGVLQLNGAVCKPLSKGNQFEILLKDDSKGKGKKTNYRWMADSPEEYKFWVLAINKAVQVISSMLRSKISSIFFLIDSAL